MSTRHHHPTHFYDSANPASIPSGVLAAVYVNTDGSFAWDQAEVDRMRGVFGISESGNPEYAAYARCIAIEPGAASPGDIAAFGHRRRELGHHDVIGYVNGSDWEATERAALDAGLEPVWWVASPGNSHPEELRSPIRGHQPVAVQTFWGGAYDMSVVLGELRFSPPHEFHATG